MDRSNRVFSRLTTFDTAYPELQDVVVRYKQYMMGSPAGQGTDLPDHHSIRNYGGVIACTNPLCNKGGFEVDRDIPASDDGDKDAKPKLMMCSGHEKMGRGQTRRCGSWIRYKSKAIPKETERT
jgi:hypothetical protein